MTATRWVADEPMPGLVEVTLNDAWGRVWKFIDKAPIFDEHDVLAPDAIYPIEFDVACTVLGFHSIGGQRVAKISTADPGGVETVEGTYLFDVAC